MTTDQLAKRLKSMMEQQIELRRYLEVSRSRLVEMDQIIEVTQMFIDEIAEANDIDLMEVTEF